MALIPGQMHITGLDVATIPSLVNGGRLPVTVPVRASAIPAKYHWVTIPNIPAAETMVNTVASIRAHYSVISAAAIAAENLARGAGGGVPLPVAPIARDANHAASTWAATQQTLRTEAIILGAVRTSCISLWGLTPADLVAAEVVASTSVTWDVAANQIQTVHPLANNTFTLEEQLAYNFAPLTPVEQDVCFYLLKFAMAAVPLAGLTLLNTGHHYLDSAKAAHLAVTRQIRSEMSAEVKAWFDARPDSVVDMIWHKSVHPVGTNFLKLQACDHEVPQRIKIAGLGAAAVRLPYTEPEVRAAEAMIAVVNAVQEPIVSVHGVLQVPALVEALDMVKHFVVGAGALAAPPFPAFPTITTRQLAITMRLQPAMERSAVAVAYAIGVYEEMLEAAGVARGRASLMEARSLARIKNDQIPSVASGRMFYENYQRVQRTMAQRGEVPAPDMTITMA